MNDYTKINFSIDFNDISLINNGQEYIIEYKGRYFVINDYIYNFLTLLKKNTGKDILEKTNLTQQEFDFVLNSIENKLKTNENKGIGNIYLKTTIFGENSVKKITNILKHIIPKNNIYFFIILLFLIVIFFTLSKKNLNYNGDFSLIIHKYDIVFLYISLFLASIFHEFGHASATKKFNLSPGAIGFGIFFIFPVFFSNVSSVWGLNRNKRIVVNLSGIYFQLIFAIIITCLFVDNHSFLKLFIKTNIAMIIFSLFPFLKNDGYWVISDYFNIKNLYSKSYTYLFDFIKKKQQYNIFLFIYSITHLSLLCFLMFHFIVFLKSNIMDITIIIPSFHFDYILLILKFFFHLIILYSLIMRLIHFFKSSKNV